LNGGGGFAEAVIAEFLVIHVGDFNMDVDAIQYGARDALLVAGESSGGTGVGFEGIPVITAGTGIHGSHEAVINTIDTLLSHLRSSLNWRVKGLKMYNPSKPPLFVLLPLKIFKEWAPVSVLLV
jgi:hypothetical protein